jgi:hypothetical protein
MRFSKYVSTSRKHRFAAFVLADTLENLGIPSGLYF